MAFTVTEQKCSVRRERLRRAQVLLNELIAINETADRTRASMLASGVTEVVADTANAVNGVLASAGPAYITAATDIEPHADCNTVLAQLIRVLCTKSISWTYVAE